MNIVELEDGTELEFPDGWTGFQMQEGVNQYLRHQKRQGIINERNQVKLQKAQEQLAIHDRVMSQFPEADASWAHYLSGKLPFSAGGAMRAHQYNQAMEKYKEGKASVDEIQNMLVYERDNAPPEDRGMWRNILRGAGEVATNMPAFGVEMLMGAGAFRAGQAGTAAVVGRAGLAARAAGGVGGAITQASTMLPHRLWENTERQRMKGRSTEASVGLGLADTAIEVFTERLGGKVLSSIPGLKNITQSQKLQAVRKWIGSKIGSSKPNVIDDVLKSGFIGSPVEEFGEERWGEWLRWLTGVEEDAGMTSAALEGRWEDVVTQMGSEIIGFMPFQGARAAGAMLKPRAPIGDPGAMHEPTREQYQPELSQYQPTRETAYAQEDKRREQEEWKKGYLEEQEQEAAEFESEKRRVAIETLTTDNEYRSKARQHFLKNPDRIVEVAQLPDDASRTEYARAAKIPRSQVTKQMRRHLRDFARDAQDLASSPDSMAEIMGPELQPPSPKPQPALKPEPDQFTTKTDTPGVRLPKPVSEVFPKQKPEPKPELPAPEPEPVQQEEQPTYAPEVQPIVDQLQASDRTGLLDFAKTMGIKIERPKSKSRSQVLDEIVAAMSPKKPAPPPKLPLKPTREQWQPEKSALKPIRAEGKPSLGPFRYPGEKPTPKQFKKKFDTKKYLKQKDIAPREKIHQDIVDFAASMNLQLQWFTSPRKDIKGYYQSGVAYVHDTGEVNESVVWRYAGHEIAHGIGADRAYEEFGKELVERGMQRYRQTVGKDFIKEHNITGDKLVREGVAEIFEEFMADKKFRDHIKATDRPTWKRIIDYIADRISLFTGKKGKMSHAQRSAAAIISKAKASAEYQNQVIDEYAEEYWISPDASEVERTAQKLEFRAVVHEYYKEARAQWDSVEAANSKAKQLLGLNVTDINRLKEAGKDYSNVKNFDTVARTIASEYGTLGGLLPAFEESALRPDDQPYSEALWDMLSAKRPMPKMSDEVILDKALNKYSVPSAPMAEMTNALKQQFLIDQGVTKQDIAAYRDKLMEDMGLPKLEADSLAIDDLLDAMLIAAEEKDMGDLEAPPFAKAGKDRRKEILDRIAKLKGGDALLNKLKNAKVEDLPTQQELDTLRHRGLTNPGEKQEARELLYVDHATNEWREVKRNKDIERRAKARIQSNGEEAELDRLIEEFKKPGGIDRVDQEVAIMLLNKLANLDLADMTEKDIEKRIKLHRGYRLDKGEAARKTARRDYHSKRPEDLHRQVVKDMLLDGGFTASQMKQLVGELKSRGYDISNPNVMKDQYALVKVISFINSRTPLIIKDQSLFDRASRLQSMWREYLNNSLLFNFKTPLAEIATNFGYGLVYSELYERPTKILLNKLRGMVMKKFGKTPEVERQWSEWESAYKAMIPSLREAVVNAAHRWLYEYSPLALSTDHEGYTQKWAYMKPAITAFGDSPGAKTVRGFGRVVRTGYRNLGFGHELFATIRANMAAAGFANNQALREGYEGEGLQQRKRELMSDRTSNVWHRGMNDTEYSMLSGKVGATATSLKKGWGFLTNIPIAGAPFTLTSPFANFIITAGSHITEKTPGLGLMFALLTEGARASQMPHMRSIQHDIAPVDWDRVGASQIFGLLVGALAYGLVEYGDDDEGLPLVTGSLSYDPGIKQQQYATVGPMMIRAPGTDQYFSYERFEPLNTMLPAAIDFARAIDDPGITLSEAVVDTAGGQLDKNYMQGINDLFKTFEHGKPSRDSAYLFSNWIVAHVPNIIRQPRRDWRNEMSESRPSKGMTVWDMVKAKSELMNAVDEYGYRYDVFGKKIKPGGAYTSLGARLVDVFSPSKTRTVEEIDPLRLKIMRFNDSVSEKERFKKRDPRPIEVEPPMTAKEYSLFAKAAGERAYNRIMKITLDHTPTKAQMQRVNKIIDSSRDIERRKFRRMRKRGATYQD